MKKTLLTYLLIGASACAWAGGVKGKVTDDRGYARKNVTVKAAGYAQTTKTNASGEYWLTLPSAADGSRLDIYVNGKLAANCLIPEGDEYATVNVVIEKR
ncbi:hypothetical protein [Haloferula sp. A504]|uniref:hypothetical protein n=1 Tax=Haloferula sp. A504 TaxID=3373601 RepID=UPI0031CAB8C8|nr:hypothetical protein [Verrucomicrobiaceae bacterium E54]